MNWINIRDKQPDDLQNILFLTTDKEKLIGFFERDKNDIPHLIGTVWTGTVIKKDMIIRGIGFHVWNINEHEVTHWSLIEFPNE